MYFRGPVLVWLTQKNDFLKSCKRTDWFICSLWKVQLHTAQNKIIKEEPLTEDNRKSRSCFCNSCKHTKLFNCRVLKWFVLTYVSKPASYKTVFAQSKTVSEVLSVFDFCFLRPTKMCVCVHLVWIQARSDPPILTTAAPATVPETYWPFQKMLLYHQASLFNWASSRSSSVEYTVPVGPTAASAIEVKC